MKKPQTNFMRLDLRMKEKLKNEIESGVSINKISECLNVPKSTVYYYYKKIKGRLYNTPDIVASMSEQEGEIVGIFAGDGSQYFEPKRYRYEVNVHFGIKNKWYAEYVKGLFDEFFQKSFRLQEEEQTKLRLRTESKNIFEYFSRYLEFDRRVKHATVQLKSIPMPTEFKIGFLRGLFDTDGCIRVEGKGKRIRIFLTTTSSSLAKQVHELLDEIGIKNKVYVSPRKEEKTVYIVNVWKESTNSFINQVRPRKAVQQGLVAKPGIASPWLGEDCGFESRPVH